MSAVLYALCIEWGCELERMVHLHERAWLDHHGNADEQEKARHLEELPVEEPRLVRPVEKLERLAELGVRLVAA